MGEKEKFPECYEHDVVNRIKKIIKWRSQLYELL
jgi:hypothetical protein